MSTSAPPLIPPSFFFRAALPCPRVEKMPREGKGRLLDLPDRCVLPAMGELDGRATWAEIRVGWNPAGLGIAVEVAGKEGRIIHDPNMPEDSDGVQLWIDSRDTRDIHRATRYCQRFHAMVVPGTGKTLNAAVRPLKIHRSVGDPPAPDLAAIRSAAERTRTGYRLEVFLPASALHGYDPETNRRLGFMYRATDPDRGDQFLTGGREFPMGEDPSLWATLELIETD